MKKALALVAVFALIAMLSSSCATVQPVGALYSNLKLPVATGTSKGNWTKVGVAQSKSILSLVATGDSSIATACANAQITEIVYVDWEVENILGVIGEYKTIVYGN